MSIIIIKQIYMKKISILFIAILLSASGIFAQSIYKVDPAHTSVNFKVKHMGITFVSGKFEKFDGGIIGSPNDLENTRVFFNIDMSSVNTSVTMRDDHLRSPDFFEVEKYPSMSFESTSIEKISEDKYLLNGKLQIKDKTNDVTFDVKYGGSVTGQGGTEVVGFIAKNTINRLDYNVSGDPEGLGIGLNVDIVLYLEFKKE